MTPEEARIVLLEDALIQAQRSIDFLHNCLVNPVKYMYGHPEHTIRHLEDFSKLVPLPLSGCYHSGFKPDCICCVSNRERSHKVMEAKNILARTV